MKNNKIIVLFGIVLIAMVLIAGCAGRRAQTQDTETQTPPTQPAPSPSPSPSPSPAPTPAPSPPSGPDLSPSDFDITQPADEDNSLDDTPTVQ